MEINLEGKVGRLVAKQKLPISIDEAWAFFSDPKNLSKITPKQLNFNILFGADKSIFSGQIIQYKVSPLPFYRTTWVTEITHAEAPNYFVDEQRYGPYDFWHHKHFFTSIPEGVEIEDIVDFKVPFGRIGKIFSKRLIRKELQKIFNFRNQQLKTMFGQV